MTTLTPSAPADVVASAAWLDLKAAVLELQPLQVHDGSIPKKADHAAARTLVERIVAGIHTLAPSFPHDAAYLDALVVDLERWKSDGFGIPDFYDALVAFHPEQHRDERAAAPRACSRCTPRTAAPTGSSRPCSSRSSGPSSSRTSSRPTRMRCSYRSASSTSRTATTPTRRCCFPRRSRCARSRPSRGGRSSPTERRPASAGSPRRSPRSPNSTCPTTPRDCSTTRSSPKRPS